VKAAADRLNGLRWRMRAMRRLWSGGVEPDMPFLAPGPSDGSPVGEVDVPAEMAQIEDELLYVSGWTIFPSAPLARVEVWLGDESLGRARVGVERPDLGDLIDIPWARFAGFELSADLGKRERSEVATLRVRSISTDGEHHDIEPISVEIVGRTTRQGKSDRLPLPPATTPTPSGPGRKALVYTHQLNLGGAQLYLMDLLRELIAQQAINPTVISALDGSLRTELEALGVPVHIAGPSAMQDLGGHLGRVEELVAWAAGREFELAIVNTATALALPGAELAERLGIPAVWTVHESFPLSVLWRGCDPEVREMGEATLANASAVIFEAEATRRMFEERISKGSGHVIPYGLDLTPIEEMRANFDPVGARRDADIPEDAEIVLCVGTVEPRKAQLPLAQAFDLIAERHQKAHLVVVGVGGDPYSQMLAGFASASLGGERIKLISTTPHVQRWYAMADILVCASDIESLPRTVLEAMAWETPVLATRVFGLPEVVKEGKTGWLCESRDILAMAEGLDRALSSTSLERDRMAKAARELVVRRHSLPEYAKHITEVLDDLMNRGPIQPQRRVTAQ
jgi:D-inositol-3-phosphate glycosyltransferase